MSEDTPATAPSRPDGACACVEKVNTQLKPLGLTLALELVLKPNRLATAIPISTERIDGKKRGRKTPVFASFCPWCGVRLDPLTAEGTVS